MTKRIQVLKTNTKTGQKQVFIYTGDIQYIGNEAIITTTKGETLEFRREQIEQVEPHKEKDYGKEN